MWFKDSEYDYNTIRLGLHNSLHSSYALLYTIIIMLYTLLLCGVTCVGKIEWICVQQHQMTTNSNNSAYGLSSLESPLCFKSQRLTGFRDRCTALSPDNLKLNISHLGHLVSWASCNFSRRKGRSLRQTRNTSGQSSQGFVPRWNVINNPRVRIMAASLCAVCWEEFANPWNRRKLDSSATQHVVPLLLELASDVFYDLRALSEAAGQIVSRSGILVTMLR